MAKVRASDTANKSYEPEQVKQQITHLLSAYRSEGLASNLSLRSLKEREMKLRAWVRWMERAGRVRPMEAVTAEDINAYLVAERERGLAPSTIALFWTYLHAWFNWLVRWELIDRSPMEHLRIPKVGLKVTLMLSDDEVRQLLATCDGKDFLSRRDRALIYFLLDTGLRASELLSIRANGVNMERRRIVIPGKGGDERLITYSEGSVARSLSLYIYSRAEQTHRDNPALWISARGALSYQRLRAMVKARGEAAGLDMWPHRFRHQFAHLMLADGAQEHDVARLGGWKNTKQLERYGAALATERALESHDKHGPGNRF